MLDFSNLSGGPAQAEPGDAGTEAGAQDAADDPEAEAGAEDAPTDLGDPDTSPDGPPDAGCSVLSCGACQQPCPPEGCLPIELASGPAFADTPRGLAVDSDALVWVNQGSGQIVRLSDALPTPQVLTTGQSPIAIAASPGLLVWAERDGVWACTSADCDTTKRLLGDSLAGGSIRAVALDGTTAYWTDRGASATASEGRVQRCEVESGATPEDVATGQFRATGLFVGTTQVFWTNEGDGYETGSLFRKDKNSGTPLDVSQALRLPTGVVADDVYSYWTQATSDGRILRCAYLEGYCETPTDVAPAAGDLGHPADVILGGGRLYFGTTDDGTVRSCPLPDCGQDAPKVHVAGRAALSRIAVGTSCLFWTDGENGGSVMKVAR